MGRCISGITHLSAGAQASRRREAWGRTVFVEGWACVSPPHSGCAEPAGSFTWGLYYVWGTVLRVSQALPTWSASLTSDTGITVILHMEGLKRQL